MSAQTVDVYVDGALQHAGVPFRAAGTTSLSGILSAAPTAVAGWAEWALSDHATKRVGVAHAAANGAADSVLARAPPTAILLRPNRGRRAPTRYP